ncbi:MAG: major capsid protein [Cytophagaceae bacterium]|nr:major capsid protein [Cytophagaceae bacterium]
MPSISTTDAQGLQTKMILDFYKERNKPTGFLRAMFPDKVAPTLELSIEVQRGSEKIAVDVVRGTDGNRNQITRSTEKIWIPPYFREWFDATSLQLYDRLYGATEINDQIFTAYINSVADAMVDIKSKIERRYELMCSQVLETGIVTLVNGTNIDFKRKSASLVNLGAGNYWATAGVDPYAQIEALCNFVRTSGKYSGPYFNLVLGSTALSDLLRNSEFLKRQNLFSMTLDQVAAPLRNSEGAALHGEITCGAYKVRLWSYPQFYEDASGTLVPYINPKKAILLPETPQFRFGFAAVPQLITPGAAPKTGAYIFGDIIDQRAKAHIYEVESAGMPIPLAIDQMATIQPVA